MRVKDLLAIMEDDPQWLGPAGVWLRPYGVSIAALIGHWHAVDHDVEQVAADYKSRSRSSWRRLITTSSTNPR